MEKTEQEIRNVMNLLYELGCTKDLSGNDIDIIRYRLKLIAGCAVNETQNKIAELIPKLYEQVTKL